MRWIALLVAATTIILPGAALAGTPYVEKMTCPVGGETFDFVATASYSTWGARPDGKPYGSWVFPLPLPECPTNGLVVYKDFSTQELQKLPGLLATADYANLKGETPRYRAAWLERQLNPASSEMPWLLLEASWEADQMPALRRRYLEAFVSAMEAGEAAMNARSRFIGRLRQVNALRELGQFVEAEALLGALGAIPPPVGEYTPDDIEEDRKILQDTRDSMSKAISRKDASMEPLDLLPLRIAAGMCLGGYEGDPPPRNDPLCTSDQVRSEIEKIKAARAVAYGAMEAADEALEAAYEAAAAVR